MTRCIQLAGAALDSLALNVALSTGVAADKAGVAGKCFRKSLKIIMPLINGIHRISVLNLVSVVLFGCMVAMILGAKMTHPPRCLDFAEVFCPDQPHPKQVDEVLDLLAEAEQMERCFPDVPS